ncbi:nicotinate phosphoribosyltransferase [bacterium]|nr:nicotinate phosphoribosyltransferase [bacterium]
MSSSNILLLTDSYKVSHHRQYPPGTQNVYSYFESRGGVFPETVFFGLQYYLKQYLAGTVVTQERIDEAADLFALHFGDAGLFHRAGWELILERHGGRLPVVIRAVPEGTVAPVSNVLMTVENTDPDCFWLTNYLETLLVQVWYGSTVATQSREMKRTLLESLERTGDPSLVDFKLHDFGYRGVSSVETAGVGSAAHLISFRGTDTLAGIRVARDFYGCPMAGHSIPAAEHSTQNSWGRDHEVDAMRNMLTQFPTGPVAVVSDSYDIFHACRNLWGGELKHQVLARDGVLVVRPDSGHPPDVVVRVLELLGEAFGTETNSKGYRVLNSKVRVIQGDGIDREMLSEILAATETSGWSTDNVAFGSGGGLLQKLNRDTSKYAFKCASVVVDSVKRDVFKQPVTDPGKQSKRGRLALVKRSGQLVTVQESDCRPHEPNELVEVFRDGAITAESSFDEVRRRAML